MDFKPDHVAALADMQADIVHADCSAIMLGRRDGNLELARQEGELRMERAPLADDLAPGARIHQFVFRRTGIMIGCHVADTVTGGLDGMHLDLGQLGQHVRDVF